MTAPTFRDLIAADIGKTFINPKEFADLREVDGKPMHVIVDSNELVERQVNAGTHSDGTYTAATLIYIPISEYGPRPKIGKVLRLDKRSYIIKNVIDEDGIYSMEMEACRT